MKTLLIILALAVPVYAQTDLVNVGKIGIQTPTPEAILDLNIGVNGPLFSKVFRVRTNEPGAGDYGMDFFSYDGAYGETRRDNVLCFGYNIGSVGWTTTDPRLHMCFENNYRTSQGRNQSEFYFTAAAAGVDSRPISIDLYHDDGSTQVGITTKSFILSNPATGLVWARLSSFSTGQNTFGLIGNSSLDFYAATREYFISWAGTGLMGKVGNNFKLFTGGLEGETMTVFEGSSSSSAPLSFKFGNGGLKLASGQWQMSTPSGSYVNIAAVKPPCAAITDSAGTRGENRRAINAVLACLRTQGIVSL